MTWAKLQVVTVNDSRKEKLTMWRSRITPFNAYLVRTSIVDPFPRTGSPTHIDLLQVESLARA